MTDQPAEPGTAETALPLRVAFVPGVTPGKWSRIWSERTGTDLDLRPIELEEQLSVLRDGDVDLCFVRLPVDRDGLHLIPLYREVPVVIVPKEHVVTAFDEIAVADLADEHLLQDPDDVPEWRDVATELREGSRLPLPEMTTAQAVEVVAAGGGVMIVPMSLARLHHRRDVTYRPVTGVAESQIGLAWRTDREDPRIEDFIGVVRGRTARSSRGMGGEQPKPEARSTGSNRSTARAAGSNGRSGRRSTKPRRRRR